MTELCMFLGTLVVGCIWLFVGPRLLRNLDKNQPVLRVGLWINGITGEEANRVVEFNHTGRIRAEQRSKEQK